ncbi:MAG: hypothetical protein Q8P66_02860, partial [Candidatus Colwellbacteria bacterium]|nr:hypothetical protein [Candidatus Colwellbacteria bacterium]
IDLANAILDQEDNVRKAEDCTRQIFNISRAIIAIKEGRYGICQNKDCEGDGHISIKRLQAVQWAIICVDCKKKQEANSLLNT